MGKVDGPDTDKSEWIKLECLVDSENPDSRYSEQLAIFKDGFPEERIKSFMAIREIESLITLKEPADKTRMFWTSKKSMHLKDN
jgi:hypothetical protein